MNVPEVEAFIEGKTLFTGARVKNQVAAGLSGRPATFSGWPAIYFLQNWPASCLSPPKMAGQLPGMAGNAAVCLLGPVLPFEGKFQAFPCNGKVKSLRFGCVPMPRSSEVHFVVVEFCLSSCCFAYRVVCRADVFCVFESLLSV